MAFNIKHLTQSKFNVDLIWNMAGFFICAIIGLLINIIIIEKYNAATLGYFNQVYALYIFLSQVATWGIHLSVQKYVPQFAHDNNTLRKLLSSALIASFIWATFVMIIVLIFNRLPGMLFNSDDVKDGFIYAVPGLLFFSLNKVMLAYINGIRQMKTFALFSTLRFFLMLAFLILFVYSSFPYKYITLIFAIPECLLFIFIFSKIFRSITFSFSTQIKKLIQIHYRFGNKAALGNIVLDLNSKVDIIVLGIFLSDTSVGIYSFAAFIVDGFVQVFFVFRNNINPIITKCYYKRNSFLLQKIITSNVKKFYRLFILLGLIALASYPLLYIFLSNQSEFWVSYGLFSILTLGCLIGSGYIPFQMIFGQTGKPFVQTSFLLVIFGSNLVLNILLIPFWGVWGSAVATGIVYALQACFLKYFVRLKLSLSI